jgi:lysyl-tRNA synthetase, class II
VATLRELRDARIEKLNKLKELGVDPYPAKSYRELDNNDVVSNFEQYEGKEVIVAGRVLSIREHGKLAFADIKDQTGKLQLYIKANNLENVDYRQSEVGFGDLHLLDTGDFVEGRGIVTKTKSGEVSVEVMKLRLLTKSLRPIPEELTDKEVRLRRRYLDTNVNPEVFERFIRKAKFWDANREFYKQNGFIEINIPVLEQVTGGADANPFVTHMDSLDQDFYLRISQELYLKRLIGGGYHKVYEIGPRFRNEGLSDEHLPEHIATEFYWAYADYRDGMELIKEMFRYICQKVYGTMQFNIKGFDVDLAKEWEIIDFSSILKERFNIDIFHTTLDEVKNKLSSNGQKVDANLNINRGIDQLWKLIRPTIGGPAFMINEPKFLSPLAKSSVEEPDLVQRIHPVIGGSELGNGYSELNDPIDQLNRFLEQQNLRESGDSEAQMLDIDFVEMLEYGMPPTFGWGHSERVFWFLENIPAREGVPFPQLRHEVDSVTKGLYPKVFGEIDPVAANTVRQNDEEKSQAPNSKSQTEANDKFVVGKILEINKHPNADKLVICKVDVGSAKPEGTLFADYVQIVTGASNISEGDYVPVALQGAVIPSTGDKLKKGNLRGERSEAMMCSQWELGISEERSGIWILGKEEFGDKVGQIFSW